MIKYKKSIFFLTSYFLLLTSSAYPMSQSERVQDAQAIINLFTQQYGPMKWKEENLGLNFNEQAGKFIDSAKNAQTDKEFYKATALFLGSFKDAHISHNIPSSFKSYLPFEVEYFKDAVVVTWVDKEKELPLNAGDKLIAIDNVPVESAIDALIPFSENGYLPTDRKYAGSFLLTYRPQTIFPEPPTGSAVLTIEPLNGGGQKNISVDWITTGFDLAEMPAKSAFSYMMKAVAPPSASQTTQTFIEKFNDSHYVNLSTRPEMDNSFFDLEPHFKLWENFEVRMKSPYFTGTFTVNGKKIGFIRINSWKGSPFDPRILDFEKEIEYMNENTDALVIDQTANGGGNACYMNEIASFFTTTPKDEIKFQVRANRTWLTWLESDYISASEDQKPHALAWLESLREAVTNGEYLSKPLPGCSITGKVLPHRNTAGFNVLYIKPVLLLINELDFSAADMFPALMQDWGAAVLFGTRTAGAGGNVIEAWPIGNSELSIRLTQSLMYRNKEVLLPNDATTHYVENVGVTPEISYEVTSKDHYDEYKSYREAINSAILNLLQVEKNQ